jgi:hypothetical protein
MFMSYLISDLTALKSGLNSFTSDNRTNSTGSSLPPVSPPTFHRIHGSLQGRTVSHKPPQAVRQLLLIMALFTAVTATEMSTKADGESEFMTDEEIETMCKQYWDSWSPAIVPEGMSPANALRALQVANSPFHSLIIVNKSDEKGGLITVDTLHEHPRREKYAEEAFATTHRPGPFPDIPNTYVDYYEGALIKTDFGCFPALNARGYDKDYGKGAAQKALDSYAGVDKKMDLDDRTLSMKTIECSACIKPVCQQYPVPSFIRPHLMKGHKHSSR